VISGGGGILGLVTPHEIKRVARDRWTSTPLRDVMRPIDQLRTIQPDTPVIDALRLMGREDVNQLPVMSAGKLEGIVGRSHILQLLQARAELKNTPGARVIAAPRPVPPVTSTPVSPRAPTHRSTSGQEVH
jgi:signal-transduction protein with cAMP-binding, CBS, and nucleotidyltransferase domain